MRRPQDSRLTRQRVPLLVHVAAGDSPPVGERSPGVGGRSCAGERSRPCPAAGVPEQLDELKAAVAPARLRAHRTVNTELLALYWQIGHKIVERQQAEGWGT